MGKNNFTWGSNWVGISFPSILLIYSLGFDVKQLLIEEFSCGQSYKHFMLIIYESRWGIFKSGATLEL